MFSSIVNWVGDKLYMFMPAAPGAVGITPELLEKTRNNLKHVDTKVKGIETNIFAEENCCKKCDLIMKDVEIDIETITEDLCSGEQDEYRCENGVCVLKEESEYSEVTDDESDTSFDTDCDSENDSEFDSENDSEFDSENDSEFDSEDTSESDEDSLDENIILKKRSFAS
jgi:hypothetical protein